LRNTITKISKDKATTTDVSYVKYLTIDAPGESNTKQFIFQPKNLDFFQQFI
jgi:hypothetical protein